MSKKRAHILAPGANSERDLSCSNLASHRLRLAVAARGLEELSNQLSVGDNTARTPDILLVGKIGAQQIESRAPLWLRAMQDVRNAGGLVILDYTDNHLGHQSAMTDFYSQAITFAQQIVVPSEGMKANLPGSLQNHVAVIPDALEYEPVPPRQTSTKKGVWFGHGSNLPYLVNYFQRRSVARYFDELIICTDSETLAILSKSSELRYMPPVRGVSWSIENQRQAVIQADFVFLPVGVNDSRKCGAGLNRLMTALCLGAPVFTQPLPSYLPFTDCFVDIDSANWPSALLDFESLRQTVELAQSSYVTEFCFSKILRRWIDLLDPINF